MKPLTKKTFACRVFSVVITPIIPLTRNMCEKAVPVNCPLLSCTQCDDQEYHANQIFSNSMLMHSHHFLLIHQTAEVNPH